ncbi:hypothetical protein [Metabacillus halosaccharovorans]|uniref:Uncharacterized protein n=1 Tax=Metabacillus halosaccharovorans TaxID=930124 RepID=A0ABT3DHA7_9BACI|nr:hypothetical protein [Metabacillus halosaccharovorans]MCV9886062.1 hypothetical protein [Metabacillus halosaccharovorans]
MVTHVHIKKLNEINNELSTISRECERAFSEWVKDRSNTDLLREYKKLLGKRGDIIKEYKSYLIIN